MYAGMTRNRVDLSEPVGFCQEPIEITSLVGCYAVAGFYGPWAKSHLTTEYSSIQPAKRLLWVLGKSLWNRLQ